ncbi:MAG: hypothetical protein LBR07_07750 [Puniceicoccales bacterium]|jgi:hypothetical protein|nr:hypothetical protein [Puniceicoccales bacterium]
MNTSNMHTTSTPRRANQTARSSGKRKLPLLAVATLAAAAFLVNVSGNANAAGNALSEPVRTKNKNTAPIAIQPDNDYKKWAAGFGFSVYACDLSTFVGFDISAYRHIINEHHRLKLGLGVFFDVNPQDIPNTNFPYTKRYSDGRVEHGTGNLEGNHYFVPVTIGYQYEMAFDAGKRWKGRAFAEVGFGVLNGTVELAPHVDNYKNNQGSDTAVVALAGVGVGVTWTISKFQETELYLDTSITGFVTSKAKLSYKNCHVPGGSTFDREESGTMTGARFLIGVGLKW